MNTITQPVRAETGVAGLDEVLHGGLIAGRLYLIDGNPGTGKTTLAMQFLLAGVRANEKCLFVTLSETKQELQAGARSRGWSLDGIGIIELIADERELDTQEQLTMLPPSEVELSETTRNIIEAIKRNEPQRVVLDSLSELRLLAQSSLRYRRQILALKQFFMSRRCTVLMLDDRVAEGPDLQLHSIAHGVIALDSESPAYGQLNRQVQVHKLRSSDFVSGRHDCSLSSSGLSVFPRLVSADHIGEFKREWIASGVASLDKLLGGGVDRGTSTLLTGPPGTGKSTIAIQYAIAASGRGDHAVAFLFDENRSALLTRAKGIGMRFNEGVGAGQIDIQQIDPVAISPGEFTHRVRAAVERGARIVIIDSLNGYLNSMPQNHYLTAQMHELLSYLNGQGITTFLVLAQSGFLGQTTSATIDASYLADTVILLRYYEHVGQVKKAISVVKKRTGKHEGSIRGLTFSETGIHLSEPLMELRGILTGVPTEIESHMSLERPA